MTQVLRKLLDQPLIFEAYEKNGQTGYKVTGQGSYLRLMPDQLATPFVVSQNNTDWNQVFAWLKQLQSLKDPDG
jgi:hypothetical protein